MNKNRRRVFSLKFKSMDDGTEDGKRTMENCPRIYSNLIKVSYCIIASEQELFSKEYFL